MKTLLAFLLACTMLTPAVAGERYTIKGNMDTGITIDHDLYGPRGPALIINVPPDLSEEARERHRRWEAFCQPREEPDDLGVIHLTYAHRGCEHGRDH